MKVILTQTVPTLGGIGETKDVKSGYARNFLFPRRLAVLITDARVKELRRQRLAIQAELKTEKAILAELAGEWHHRQFVLTARASADGTLYGSVGPKELRKILGRDDLDFRMPVLKNLGSHAIDLTFRSGLVVPVVVIIQPETSV